jgi:hypothetical protein
MGRDRKVREERGLLRNVGDLALAGREVGEDVWRVVGVEAKEFDFGVGEQAGDGAEDRAFAAAGGAEDDGPVAGKREIDVEVEGAEARLNAQVVVSGRCLQ